MRFLKLVGFLLSEILNLTKDLSTKRFNAKLSGNMVIKISTHVGSTTFVPHFTTFECSAFSSVTRRVESYGKHFEVCTGLL
jgi:hypothetical protein